MSEMSFEQRLQQSSPYLASTAWKKVALALAASVALFLVAQAPVWAAPTPSIATVNAHLGAIAVPFEANEGQLAPRVAYAAQTFYGTTFVTRDGELVHALAPPRTAGSVGTAKAAIGHGWNLVEHFVGARSLAPRGTLSSPTNVSRFIGNDPARWQRNIPTYDRVDLGEPWPGIRVDVAAHGANVEKIFTVAPGVNPGRIEVAVHGALGLRLDSQGALVAQTGNGAVRFQAPKAYQMVNGSRRSVAVRYSLESPDAYSFTVGDHDATLPLTIDPLLQSTYLGGGDQDEVNRVAIDASGNVIAVGETGATDFPGTSGGYQATSGGAKGSFDIFVASLTADLTTLKQATYLGGSQSEFAGGVAIAGNGDVIVVGSTNSTDFPGTSGGYQAGYAGNQDAVVASLTADLKSLNQATYLGGGKNDGASGVAIDTSGNVIVVGGTQSGGTFPGTTNGAQPSYGGGDDGFVASLTANLKTLNQATYLGGKSEDSAGGVAIDGSGNVIVVGETVSTDFPSTTNGAQPSFGGGTDGFVASLTANLKTLNQATYLGGGNEDFANAVAIDVAGDVIVAGTSLSTDFPSTTNGAQPSYGGLGDAFVANLSSDLKTLHQSTYLGGSEDDEGLALAIDQAGNVIVAGYTNSSDFPGTTGGAQASHAANYSNEDAFLARLAPDLGTLEQATYLGGVSDDEAHGLAIDPSGNVIVGGGTFSTDFPGTTGGAQAIHASDSNNSDGFVARLTPDLLLGASVTAIPALSWAGLLALGALLALSGALLARRV